MNVKSWLGAFRPKTLTAAVVPVSVGAALASAQTGETLWWLTICILLSALLIQIATNLINDAVDFKKGADTAERVGPKRLTASGEVQGALVMKLGFACLGLAMLLGVPIVLRGGLGFIGLGLVSMFLAYGYTAGPFPLAYLGLGDVFVVLFFGVIAVVGTYFLQALHWSFDAGLAGLQIGFLATVLIAINNLRDVYQDAKANKRTWAVRFGPQFVRYEIAFLMTSSFTLLLYWWWIGYIWAFCLPLFVVPVAFQVVRGVFQFDPGPELNRLLARAALVHFGFGLAMVVGLWLH